MAKSELPLSFAEVKDAVSSLAIEFAKGLRKRNDFADYNPTVYQFEILARHVDVRRAEGEIVAVVRRYNLECQHCQRSFILGRWYLKDRETLLVCPECSQYVPLVQHHDFSRLETVMNLAPVLSIQDLFAPGK